MSPHLLKPWEDSRSFLNDQLTHKVGETHYQMSWISEISVIKFLGITLRL